MCLRSQPQLIMSFDACPPARRRKSAWERRQQRLRSDARLASRLITGLSSIDSHRGNRLSSAGSVLQRALLACTRGSRDSGDADEVGDVLDESVCADIAGEVVGANEFEVNDDEVVDSSGHWLPLPEVTSIHVDAEDVHEMAQRTHWNDGEVNEDERDEIVMPRVCTRVDDVSYDVSSGRVRGFAGHGAPDDSDSDFDDFSCNRCGASAGDANPVHGYPCPHCHACSKRCVQGHNRIAGHACHA